MTEKQRALLENLPKCNNNRTKAALMSGYSKSYAETLIHSRISKYKGIESKSDEEIKVKYLKETNKLKKKFLKAGDNTNSTRMHEIIGKVEGLFKETINTNQAGNIVIIDKQSLTDKPKVIDAVKDNIKPDIDAVPIPNDNATDK